MDAFGVKLSVEVPLIDIVSELSDIAMIHTVFDRNRFDHGVGIHQNWYTI
jgi:hypothetical protein